MSGGEVVFNAEPLGYSPRARAEWERIGSYHAGALDDPSLGSVREEATVLIVRLARRIDATVLGTFPSLRHLVSATTGLDHIDLDELARRGIRLWCLRGETEFLGTIPSTAEHTMALMLALLRHVPAAVRSVACGEWQRDRFRGRQLKGRRLGLVGLGRTGRMVAGYGQAFGMDVAYFDPNVADPAWRRFDSLDGLLANSEIVSLHVHLDETTRGMIGAGQFERMQTGAWLVNTSRGALVDEAALTASLRAGRLAGAAVDVIEGELGGIESSLLWQAVAEGLPVLITPHVGGATVDAMHQCEEFLAERFIRSSAAIAENQAP